MNTSASISLSQINSSMYFTNGNVGFNTTVPASTVDISGTFRVSGTSTLQNVTATNVSAGVLIASTGITTGTINASGTSTLQNVTATNVSTGVLIASTGVTTGTISASGTSTLQNVTATNVSTGVLIASTGLTTGTISASGTSILQNVTATNVSAGVLIASTGLTTGTISASGTSTLQNITAISVTTGTLTATTSVSSGLLSATNVIATNISTGTLSGTTITGANLSLSGSLIIGGTLTTVNITSTNVLQTNVSSGTISSTNATTTNIVGTNVSAGTITSTNFTTTNIVGTNISAGTIVSTNSTTTNIVGTNISAGSARFTGGITVGNIITLNDNSILLRTNNDAAHGLAYSAGPDGPSLWGFAGGTLAYGVSGATRVLTWNSTGVGIGIASPTQILHIQKSGSDNYIKVDAGGIESNYSGIMLTEHNINYGWSLRHNSVGDLLHISCQDNTPTFTNTVTFNRSGNVGIGTISPELKFHVAASNVGDTIRIENTNASGYATAQFKTTTQTYFVGVGGTSEPGNNFRDKLYILNPSAKGIILDTSGFVGISKNSPAYALDVVGSRINIHNSAGINGGQNLFEGLENVNHRAQIVLSSQYSDLVIASSTANNNHGSTLTFASYNPDNKADYRKWVINQGNWGSRVQMLEFGYNPNNITNPHTGIDDTYTTMTLDGSNKRLGLGNRSPSYTLDVSGTGRFTGALYASSTLSVAGILYGDNLIRANYNATINGAGSIRCSPQTNGSESSIGFYQNVNEGGAVWVMGHNPGGAGNDKFAIYSSTYGGNVLTIQNNGNVGICNNSPSAFSIRTASNFTASGSGDQFTIAANGVNGNNGYFYYNSGNGFGTGSDERLKYNITPINSEDAIAFISNITPSDFCINGQTERQSGFIAQNVLAAAQNDAQKSAVAKWETYNETDPECPFMGVSERPILSNLIVMVKHHQTSLQALDSRLSSLEQQIN